MSSPVSSPPVASRWWKCNTGVAVCDLPHSRRADEAGTVRCPRHGHLLPCEPCAVRDREASTAGWVIGLLGLLTALLLAASLATRLSDGGPQGAVAVALTLLSVAGAVAVGLLVAQTYGGEPIGIEVRCPACGSRFVWAAAADRAACPECRASLSVEQGRLAPPP